jgi:hypothetical protein
VRIKSYASELFRCVVPMLCCCRLVCGDAHANEACDEIEGHRQHEVGNWKRAYALLAPCEMNDDVMGITLYRISDHVSLGGHGPFLLPRLRRFKRTGLYFRSALLRYGPGIVQIAEVWEDEYRIYADESSKRLANCFRSSSEPMDRPKSFRCEGVYENIRSRRMEFNGSDSDASFQGCNQQ